MTFRCSCGRLVAGAAACPCGQPAPRSGLVITASPLEHGPLAAGSSGRFVARPQLYQRAQWLVLPPEVAARVAVEDVRVGDMSQVIAPGWLPGFLFAGAFTDPWDAPRLEQLRAADGDLTADQPVDRDPGVLALRQAGLRVPLVQLLGDTCQPGFDISVHLVNLSGAQIHVVGAIVGETMHPW